MQITLDIQKRGTFIIVLILLLLATGVYAITYANPLSKVGHDTVQIGSGTVAGDLIINGTLLAKSDIILQQLPSNHPARNLTRVVCQWNSTYCD